jgi:hypothetical protein
MQRLIGFGMRQRLRADCRGLSRHFHVTCFAIYGHHRQDSAEELAQVSAFLSTWRRWHGFWWLKLESRLAGAAAGGRVRKSDDSREHWGVGERCGDGSCDQRAWRGRPRRPHRPDSQPPARNPPPAPRPDAGPAEQWKWDILVCAAGYGRCAGSCFSPAEASCDTSATRLIRIVGSRAGEHGLRRNDRGQPYRFVRQRQDCKSARSICCRVRCRPHSSKGNHARTMSDVVPDGYAEKMLLVPGSHFVNNQQGVRLPFSIPFGPLIAGCRKTVPRTWSSRAECRQAMRGGVRRALASTLGPALALRIRIARFDATLLSPQILAGSSHTMRVEVAGLTAGRVLPSAGRAGIGHERER